MVINNVYHTAYHKTTVCILTKLPCHQMPSHITLYTTSRIQQPPRAALGGDRLSATKTYSVEDVVDELARKFNVEMSLCNTLVGCD
jgi:hypothetical protein